MCLNITYKVPKLTTRSCNKYSSLVKPGAAAVPVFKVYEFSTYLCWWSVLLDNTLFFFDKASLRRSWCWTAVCSKPAPFNQVLRWREHPGMINGENSWRRSFLFFTLENFMAYVPSEMLLTLVVERDKKYSSLYEWDSVWHWGIIILILTWPKVLIAGHNHCYLANISTPWCSVTCSVILSYYLVLIIVYCVLLP